MAEITFDQLSPEEKEAVVSFYNSQGMDTGSPITEATLPPARQTLSPPPVTATSLDTGQPVAPVTRSWRDDVYATDVSPTRSIMTDGPDMDEVQAFQERNGLPRDGVLDENTFRAMSAQALGQTQAPDGPPVAQEDPTQPAPTEAPVTYTIQGGDTFSKIASENTFTLDQLKAANPDITNFNNVMVGQEINLPVEGAPVVETPAVQTPVVDTPVVETTETIPSTDANNLTFRSEAVSSPTNVRSIQSLIGTSVDGDWGPKSEAALKSFQEDNGLSPTGNWQDPELVSWVEENVPVDLTDRSTTDPYRVPTISDDNIATVSTEDWVGEDRDKGASNLFGRQIQGREFTGTVSRINMGGEEREIIDVSDMVVGQIGGGTTMVPRVLVLHETDAVDSSGQRVELNGLGHFLNARSSITTQWFVDQDGRIFKITPNTRLGNHASGMNTGSLGIEVEGLSEEGGTPEAATEAAAWLSEYLVRTNPEITHVLSHHQIGRGIGAGKDDGIPQLNATFVRLGLSPLNREENVVLFNDFKQRARGN